ncbi:MAG: xanthine dehydrogenase small subunit [Sulfuriferula sp.]
MSGDNVIRFMLDNEVVEARDVAPTTTLLQYLRDTLGRCGTKEGCAEGDCGACTVVLGELDGEHISYRAINSCIRLLPTVDGKEVVTVESLSRRDAVLHPVQQSMVDHHGSQCGFCTPGFVMSLFDVYLNQPEATRPQVVDALAGNLCRCTGYRPIIDAGCGMNDYPPPRHWNRAEAQSEVRKQRLADLQREHGLDLDGVFQAPRSLDELAQSYLQTPDALLLAGGTDIGLWVTKQLRTLPAIIYLGEVAELKHIRQSDGALEIGAAVSLTDAYTALVTHYPMLAELHQRFASPPIRNSGTLCGNLANGSPIGDSIPILIALGAVLELRCGEEVRELALDEFYLAYQKKAWQAGEFIQSVSIPLPKPDRIVASYKISKRSDQDISAVCGGYAFDIVHGMIESARIAYGGMAATSKRATRTEAALIGQPWSLAAIDAALPVLAEDYTPLSDMRASADYRLKVAQNLLKRFFLEHGDAAVPCRIGHINGVSA